MKPIDKVELLDQIGTELQARMTFDDLDIYFRNHKIDTAVASGQSYNSKRTYAKDILSHQLDEKLFEIADEVGIEVTSVRSSAAAPSFWKTGYFKLFLSHLASFKVQTAALQKTLLKYGVSSFVAHEDIEPSKEWQQEIETALQTMDAIAPILMPGFKESNWCDQELGFAVAMQVSVIPIRKQLDPYGFIGKFQGIQAHGKSVGEVALEIFTTLSTSPKTKPKATRALAFACGQSTDPDEAIEKLNILKKVPNLSVDVVAFLSERIAENPILNSAPNFVSLANLLLREHGLKRVGSEPVAEDFDDDIPF